MLHACHQNLFMEGGAFSAPACSTPCRHSATVVYATFIFLAVFSESGVLPFCIGLFFPAP